MEVTISQHGPDLGRSEGEACEADIMHAQHGVAKALRCLPHACMRLLRLCHEKCHLCRTEDLNMEPAAPIHPHIALQHKV